MVIVPCSKSSGFWASNAVARIPLQSEKRSFGTAFLTARNCGVIAPGNHWIYDSLRGAPLPGRSDFALRAGTPGTAFPTVFRKCANESVGAIQESPAEKCSFRIPERRIALFSPYGDGFCIGKIHGRSMIAPTGGENGRSGSRPCQNKNPSTTARAGPHEFCSTFD